MKKILIMLAVLGCVHFGAKAQVGAGTTNNNSANLSQGDQGQKIDVIEGRKNVPAPKQSATRTTMSVTHTNMHSATAHTTAYHKPVHHTAVHHNYAATKTHKPAMHKTMHAVAMHRTVKHAYSGNRTNVYSGSGNNVQTTVTTPPVDHAKNQNAAENKKLPDLPYPGASNGGWSNGTNGKGGTNSEDGTIKTERRDN